MLSMHKILHFIHQKHHNVPFQTHYKPQNVPKMRYTNLTNKFGTFCRVRTFCAYTQPYDTVNVAKDTAAV